MAEVSSPQVGPPEGRPLEPAAAEINSGQLRLGKVLTPQIQILEAAGARAVGRENLWGFAGGQP